MCCRHAKNGINAGSVKHCINPGIQLLHFSSCYLGTVGLWNIVEASLDQPKECLSLALGFASGFSQSFALSSALDTALFAFLRHD